MRKVLIAGAGGIGSFLAMNLHNSVVNKQLEDVEFHIVDDDTVDLKNIGYQNFNKIDLTDYKADAIALRYKMHGSVKRITSDKDFAGFDCIVGAVDNSIFRRLMFNYVFKHPEVYWIDLRSEGRAVAFFTKHKTNTLEAMLSTLPAEDTASGSCQLEWELSNGIIQNGNKIIASIGSQLILNWYRNDTNPPKLIAKF